MSHSYDQTKCLNNRLGPMADAKIFSGNSSSSKIHLAIFSLTQNLQKCREIKVYIAFHLTGDPHHLASNLFPPPQHGLL